MSGIPILTALTVLPLVGAVIALLSGKYARGVALITTLCGLALALFVWTQLPWMEASACWSSISGRLRWGLNTTLAWTDWER